MVDGPVDLTGEYEFFWKELLNPQDFADQRLKQQSDFINVPGYWNKFESAGEKISGNGFATYRLTVLLEDHDKKLAFKVFDMSTAFSFLVNGEKLYSAGVVGKTSDLSKPQFNPKVIDYQTKEDQLDIIFQISNFHQL